jgi:hypothetical protein
MKGAKKDHRRGGKPAGGLLRLVVRVGFRRRAFFAAALVLGGAGALGSWAWNRLAHDVLLRSEYTLALHQVQITALPGWIHSDVKSEALRDGSLDGPLSILDEQIAERLARAFALHPWVARVENVVIHYPARVTVELVYRRPAAMVEVPGGLFAVDATGVLLPSGDFTPAAATEYPRLSGIASQPLGPVGTPWGDRGVVDGIKIAVALTDVWRDLRLQCIRRVAAGGTSAAGVVGSHFELVTKNGTVIPWGSAPGSEAAAEAPTAEKISRLRKYVADYGGLDESARRNDLDLRVRDGLRAAAREKIRS